MERTYSLNIAGTIFWVEEEAYPILKQYLHALQQFFGQYEDSTEILADLNGRIAELLAEASRVGRRLINLPDVEQLMDTLGRIEDFEEAEQDPAYQMTFTEAQLNPEEAPADSGGILLPPTRPIAKPRTRAAVPLVAQQGSNRIPTPDMAERVEMPQEEAPRRLYRDSKRGLLGGVCAGLAYYLGIDPIWVRLGFLILLTGLYFVPAAPEIAIVVYVVLWAAMPARDDLPDVPNIKKLYRNPDESVLGGVCSGLALYLGVPVLGVRLAFIAGLILFGTGFFIYAIMWVIIPAAQTLTEKMQMQGQSINLSNIVGNLHRNPQDAHPDSPFEKAVFFPFTLAGLLLRRSADVLRPFVSFSAELIRVGGGLMFILVSALLQTGLVIVALGLFDAFGDAQWIKLDKIPLALVKRSVENWMVVSAFLAIFIPIFFLGLFGVMMLRRQIIWNARVGYPVAGLWVMSLISTGIAAVSLMSAVAETGKITEVRQFNTPAGVLHLQLAQAVRGQYPWAIIRLQGYPGKTIRLEQIRMASGNDEGDAVMNARDIKYNISAKDSVIQFDKGILLPPSAKYRSQFLEMKMLIPYHKVFTMSDDFGKILRHTLSPHGYKAHQIPGKQWQFTPEGLVCLNCETQPKKATAPQAIAEQAIEYFDKIEVSGAIKVKIRKGDQPQVNFTRTEDAEFVKVEQDDNELNIYLRGGVRPEILPELEIVCPSLTQIKASGACQLETLDNFDFGDELRIELKGASQLKVQGNTDALYIEAHGAAKISAHSLKAKRSYVELNGASKASICVERELGVEAHGASTLEYIGKPSKITQDLSGASSLKNIER